MEGPFDEAEPDTEGAASPRATGKTAPAPRPKKPAGGKALFRLLDMLEPRGLDDVAHATIAIAVPDDIQPQFQADRASATARPGGPESGAPRTRGKARRERADETATDEGSKAAAAPDVAAEYANAAPSHGQEVRPAGALAAAGPASRSMTGPPTGPPTAVGPQWRSLGPTTIPNGQTYG